MCMNGRLSRQRRSLINTTNALQAPGEETAETQGENTEKNEKPNRA